MARDYYEVLGIERNATKEDVKRAFRSLARQYHPDINKDPDAEAKFKEINEAYEVLADDDKRARFDRFGQAGVNGGGFGGAGATGFGGFEDIFETFFNNMGRSGGGGGQRSVRRGADIRVDVVIDFIDAAHGIEQEIEFNRLETCDVCDGSGGQEGSQPTTCPDCNGAGEVRQVHQTFIGSVVRVAACPRCGGRGTIITNPCRNCDGSGRRRKRAKLSVKIPAGVHDGLRIQLRGEGDAGEINAPAGDLYVVVRVKDHEFFKRRDSDVILDVSLNVAQATLGDKIAVPTIDGDVELVVPPGTQTGKVFRLRGKGVPRLRTDGSSSGRGDQLVYVQVEVPTQLTDEQRALFEQLAGTFGKDIQPQSSGRGFFDRMMDFIQRDQ